MEGMDSATFAEFLESIPDALLAVDSGGVIVMVNHQAVEMFGYERNELIGEKVEILVPQRVREKHPHHRALYIIDPKKRPMGVGLELSATRKDGLEFPCDISLAPIHRDGRVLTLAAVRDASDRRRYETQFVAALTDQVATLNTSLKKVTELFEAEKLAQKGRDKNARRLTLALAALLASGIGVQWWNIHRQNNNRDFTRQVDRGTCIALNKSNDVLRNTLGPFIKFTPTEIPKGATPAEVAIIKAEDAKQKAEIDRFTLNLNKQTANQQCPEG